MNTPLSSSLSRTQENVLSTNRVLRNTYALLSATLLFSALTAGTSMALGLPHPGILITLVGYFGLLFLITKYRNRDISVLFVFALTGFMGYTLGPILSAYLSIPNGSQVISMAFGTTAVAFLGLSAYALKSRRDFSFMGSFLMVGILAGFCAGLGAIFFDMPALSLAVSGLFVLLMGGLILYETSNIIRGGETNYVMATVTLYVAIYNLFTSLLHIFGVMEE